MSSFRAEQDRSRDLSLVPAVTSSYFQNMEFENEVSAPPSTWSTVRGHLPILLLGGGAIAVFLGLHAAATGAVVIAALHLAAGVLAFVIQRIRQSRQRADVR